MFNKILVAVDGSDHADKALGYALGLAENCGSELILLTAYQRRVLPGIGSNEYYGDKVDMEVYERYWDSIKASHEGILAKAKGRVKKEQPSVKYTTELVEGRPGTEIIESARRNDVDLIVMGSRGIGGVTGWILGSTSKQVVEACTKPVLVVK